MSTVDWLDIHRGSAPLVVSFPHTGTELPPHIESAVVSPWLARKDADWWIDRLYDFAAELGATTVRTRISRTVIDCNRDPSGVSLYPGQNTTELCPTTTFDGEPLYRQGLAPNSAQIAERRAAYFDPYHGAIAAELDRLKAKHKAVVLYDAHSIRSRVPRLFGGELPHFNIGTNDGLSCDPSVAWGVDNACDVTPFTRVLNGRFKGGYTTRHYGQPEQGVHAVQMELSCRGYMVDPEDGVTEAAWPSPYDLAVAGPIREVLRGVLQSCLRSAQTLASETAA